MSGHGDSGARHPARSGRRGRTMVVGIALTSGAVALGLATGVAVARWTSSDWISAGAVGAGDLRLTEGDMTWRQVTPGVATPASGSLAATPPDFVSMPGDVVEVRLPVTTFLRGDNLVAQLAVDYAPPSPTGDIAVSFHVEDADGRQVAPVAGEAPGGGSVAVPGLEGGDAGVTAEWTVVVTVRVQGDYQWVTPSAPAAVVDWGAGTVKVRLEQVRPTPAESTGGAR